MSLVEALGFPKEQVLGFQLVLLMADDENVASRRHSKCTSIEGSCRSGKANIVLDHRVRPDRDPAGIGQIEPAENDLVAPNLA